MIFQVPALQIYALSNSAPWWASGLFATIGACFAVLLTAFYNSRSEKQRHLNEIEKNEKENLKLFIDESRALLASFDATCVGYMQRFSTLRVRWIETYPDWQALQKKIGTKRQREARILWAELYEELNTDARELTKIETELRLRSLGPVKRLVESLRLDLLGLEPWVADEENTTALNRISKLLFVFEACAENILNSFPDFREDDDYFWIELFERISNSTQTELDELDISQFIESHDRSFGLATNIYQIHELMRSQNAKEATFVVHLNSDGSADIDGISILEESDATKTKND